MGKIAFFSLPKVLFVCVCVEKVGFFHVGHSVPWKVEGCCLLPDWVFFSHLL